jgi:predicted ribosomally synthesized peptide with nif11-like leader
MSTDHIPAFHEKVQNDPVLQQKVAALHERVQRELADKLAALSQEAGTPFTSEEFLSAARAELSDAELQGVSGGILPAIAVVAAIAVVGGYIFRDVPNPHPGSARAM